jgi:hypothetical protein
LRLSPAWKTSSIGLSTLKSAEHDAASYFF